MKVSELQYIQENVQAFCIDEMVEGDFVLSVRWFDMKQLAPVAEIITNQQGKDKVFKTPKGIFDFLRSINSHSVKVEINFRYN